MVVRIISADVFGIEGRTVEIEVDLIPRVNGFILSGLPGKSIRESHIRINSAIRNSGFNLGENRIIVHLAPATLEKDGSLLDLGIALGILQSGGKLRASMDGWAVLGELSLDGQLRPMAATLALLLALRKDGYRKVLLPASSLAQAQAVTGLKCIGLNSLQHAIEFLQGKAEPARVQLPVKEALAKREVNFSEVIGHEKAKKALAVAAAGEHNVLLIGSPGVGKTLLAKRMPGLIGDLSQEEALEVTRIYSANGLHDHHELIRKRPFRAPHHTVSWAGLVGGGSLPRPGEITLAHGGVLFLDELPEFPRRSLESLREPLEEGSICISRSQASMRFPARFMLMTAMNPCPCGNYMHPKKDCHCTAVSVRRYLDRISGPLLDRIDLRLEISAPSGLSLLKNDGPAKLTTELLQAWVKKAIDFRISKNRRMANRFLQWGDRKSWAFLTKAANQLLECLAMEDNLSTRSLTRILRMARTLADMDCSDQIKERHLLQAIEYHSPRSGSGWFSLLAGGA